MSVQFELKAEPRNTTGKGDARRLRRAQRVPGVIYGGGAAPSAITVDHNDLSKSLEHEAFYSHILTIHVGGKAEKAVLKDLQRHPSEPRILHFDLQRVDETHRLHMHVPLHFLNEATAPGVKAGGIVNHLATNVEVTCLAKDLPEYIEIDLGSLQAGESIHLSDIKLPAGVELVALTHGPEHDLGVVTITMPRGAGEETAEAAPSA